MRASGIAWFTAGAVASTLAVVPATAQEVPVGPCSPYRAADGDIPSDMPGCARHRRPAPGSLDDELDFAHRRRDGTAAAPDDIDAEAPPPFHRLRRRRE